MSPTFRSPPNPPQVPRLTSSAGCQRSIAYCVEPAASDLGVAAVEEDHVLGAEPVHEPLAVRRVVQRRVGELRPHDLPLGVGRDQRDDARAGGGGGGARGRGGRAGRAAAARGQGGREGDGEGEGDDRAGGGGGSEISMHTGAHFTK
jgi:hypothetical protein